MPNQIYPAYLDKDHVGGEEKLNTSSLINNHLRELGYLPVLDLEREEF